MSDEEDYIEKTVNDTLSGESTDEVDEEYEWDPELGRLVQKGRRYINDPSEAPEGVEVQQGQQGGYFYETGEAGEDMGTGENPESVGVEDGDSGQFGNAPEAVAEDPEAAADWMASAFGQMGQEYAEEAAHQYGDHWDEYYDDAADLVEDFETYLEANGVAPEEFGLGDVHDEEGDGGDDGFDASSINDWREVPAGSMVEVDGEEYEMVDAPTGGPLLRDPETGDEFQFDTADLSGSDVNIQEDGGDGGGGVEQYLPEEPTMTGLESTLQEQGLDDDVVLEVVGHVLDYQDAIDDPSDPQHEEASQTSFEEQVEEGLEQAGVLGDDEGGGGGLEHENADYTYEDLIPNGGDGPGNIVQVEGRLEDAGVSGSEIEDFEEALRGGADLGEAMTDVVDEDTALDILESTFGFEE